MAEDISREELNEAVARWDGWSQGRNALGDTWFNCNGAPYSAPCDYFADTPQSHSAAWRLLESLAVKCDGFARAAYEIDNLCPLETDLKIAVARTAHAAGLIGGEQDAD